ncbi:phage tail protein [Paenibacillus odorifer]|uniref:Tail spike domain-containing protein n=1 Tax=Paenibacillus odorifer TaxID=189426 RepID=A0A1R0YAA3_9BACL|nr:phage tail protein [Paenibacillus odorifer]OMD44297.1 hypothetical protein BSK52_01850 [Paenibacillus odorifer]
MTNNYLSAYDKNRVIVGNLVSAYEVTRLRRINSEDALTFLVPMASEDYRDKLRVKGHVRDERGQYYVINTRKRIRDGRKLTAQISCQHVMFKLGDIKIPYGSYIKEAYGVHISQLLEKIKEASRGLFSFVVHDTFDLFDVKNWGGGTALQALNDTVNLYGVEIEPDNYVIHVRKKIGEANSDMQYRIGKNIVSSDFQDDGAALVTRMFATMKDSRTWIGQSADILTADERARLLAADSGAIVDGKLTVNYLISQYAPLWASEGLPYLDGEITEQNITDPIELLTKTRAALARMEQPVLELTIQAADLFKIDKTEPRPSLGDTVMCIDPEMELAHVTARITELTEYPYANDRNASITIANVMRRDNAQLMADLNKAKQVINDITSGGRIRAEAFEEFARLAVIDVNASKTEIKYDERGIILQSKANANDLVALTSNGIIVSTDGGATARTAITAAGIAAEQVIGQFGNFVSMLIGQGNNVVQINPHGIAAGHADFNSAPFRLDMEGNLVANRLTANSANILSSNFTNGAIVGSSINVGNGMFTVTSGGIMSAVNGEFSGHISASTISGGTITGAKLRTAGDGVYPRVEIDPSSVAFGVYADANNGIQIPAYDGGVSKIIFNANGNQSVIFNSPSSGFFLSGYGRATLNGDGVKLEPGSDYVRVPSWNKLYSESSHISLQDELSAIWSALANKANASHSHTVSIPNHNHGNPANANSGGGTFTAS